VGPIKVVQTRLGHSSAKTTLDVYGRLFRDEDDRTRQEVENALRTAVIRRTPDPRFAVSVSNATPAGVSGAVLLLPFQVSVLGAPSPAVTPTNLLYNVVATPGALCRYRRQQQTGGHLTAVQVGHSSTLDFVPGQAGEAPALLRAETALTRSPFPTQMKPSRCLSRSWP
jgi:hypothetical protein